MRKIEVLEREIENLSPNELTEFRQWFVEFDAQVWDRKFEADVTAGKLDALADKALREHEGGQSTQL